MKKLSSESSQLTSDSDELSMKLSAALKVKALTLAEHCCSRH